MNASCERALALQIGAARRAARRIGVAASGGMPRLRRRAARDGRALHRDGERSRDARLEHQDTKGVRAYRDAACVVDGHGPQACSLEIDRGDRRAARGRRTRCRAIISSISATVFWTVDARTGERPLSRPRAAARRDRADHLREYAHDGTKRPRPAVEARRGAGTAPFATVAGSADAIRSAFNAQTRRRHAPGIGRRLARIAGRAPACKPGEHPRRRRCSAMPPSDAVDARRVLLPARSATGRW